MYMVDLASPTISMKNKREDRSHHLPRLSELLNLEELWSILGDCLKELARTPDQHAVLILQPAVEAFFIVHAGILLSLLFWMKLKYVTVVLLFSRYKIFFLNDGSKILLFLNRTNHISLLLNFKS